MSDKCYGCDPDPDPLELPDKARPNGPRYYWSRYDRYEWTMRGPSRRLRKLYRALSDLDAQIETARYTRYCPEHAPSDYRMRRYALRDLDAQRSALIHRINVIQHDDDENGI